MSKLDKYLNEAKNDYVASYSGTNITIKNGYKVANEEELETLYNKLGQLAKTCKIKLGSITVVPKKQEEIYGLNR